jgi:hypothetical protein
MASSPLHTTLQSLAHAFAEEVLAAIRSSSLGEVTGAPNGTPRHGPGRPRRFAAPASSPSVVNGRPARRSTDEIEAVLGRVVAALKTGPMRAEEIQKSLGLHRKELPRVIKLGLQTKAIKRKGQKRATVYTAG